MQKHIDHVPKPRRPTGPLTIGLLVVAGIALLAGLGGVLAVAVEGDDVTPIDGNESIEGDKNADIGTPEPAEAPEEWAYTFTPQLGAVQFGIHVATISTKDTPVARSPNQTLDEYGEPRLEARVFALPFDITTIGLGPDPFAGLNAAMNALGDAPSYATLRAKASGTYMDFVAPYYMTFDGENITALRSIAMTSTQTRQVSALNAGGQLLTWDPTTYDECTQYQEPATCVGYAWKPTQKDAEGNAIMAAG